ncbi:RNA polymerase II accessory factor, partial [Paraphysoderma sedebokerense]
FSVRGFYVKYHDAPPPTPVSFWNVHMLNVDRNKRHLDQPVVIQFWTELEKWVLGNKPHLVTV